MREDTAHVLEAHESLIERYLEEIESSEEVGERVELLRQMASILANQFHDCNLAYEALETAFELDIEDDSTVTELEKMASAAQRWPKLVELVNARIERETEPRAQLSLCRRLAKWYSVDLDREHYAEPYYRRVLALDPLDVSAARKLADCCERRGDWRERGRILEGALEVASAPADRAAVLTDLGELYERHVDAEQGLARYQRAFSIARDYLPALVHLERIYQDCNMTEPLIEVLRAIAECGSDAEALAINLRIGRLLESTVQRVEAAIDVYRNVLATQPDNALAIQGLGRCFTTTRNWPALREVLNMRLDCAQSERERVTVLIDMAVLEDEQFLQTSRAAQRLELALEIDGHNERAYQLLARAYRKLRQWHALVGCLERHIAATNDRHQTISLHLQIAEVAEGDLVDHARAIAAYGAVVSIDGDHLEAQRALAKLYEAAGDTEKAVASMAHALELVEDPAQRVATLCRMGHLLEERLEDRAGASEHFHQALDLDPTYLPALAALRAMAIDEKDWQRAAHYLDEEQQHTTAPRKRAQLLVELGRLRAEKLDEPARETYELAHACDPNNDEAAWRLARCYVEEGAWEDAEPLTEMLMKKAKQKDERVARSLLHARVQGAVGNTAGALDAYETARGLDATNSEAIRGLAGASFECGDWGRARKSYLEVLSSLRPNDVNERADICYRLGTLEREEGQEHAAIHYFDQALAADPRHRATLEAMVAIHERIGDFSLACRYRQKLLEVLFDPEERYASLTELGHSLSRRVGDSQRALESYERALALKPDDHRLMHRMLELYQETDRWDSVVEMLGRIVGGDSDRRRRSRYLFTMAQVYREKIGDSLRAAEVFDETLDADPDCLEAFQRIDRIYTTLQDWPRLERAYRKMIHRAQSTGQTELEYQLWHALGLIYRDRLKDNEKALGAFSAAPRVKPDATEDYLILGELAKTMGHPEQALAHYRALLEHDPMNVDAYRAMHRIFRERGELDGAWCAAAVLSFLNAADEEEQRFFEERRRNDLPEVQACLEEQAWIEHLCHRDADRFISKIFEAVAVPALKAQLVALKTKKQLPVLPEQCRQDPLTSTGSFARTLWWAADILGIEAPVLYARTDVPGGIVAAPAQPLASIAGRDVLTRLGALDRAYVAGRHLAGYRAEHYVKAVFPTITELTVVFFAAIRLVRPELPAPPEYAREVQLTTPLLAKHLTPPAREYLKLVVEAFVSEGARANIKRWAQAVDATAARAGFLLCGDLEVAWSMIAVEPRIVGDLRPEQRIRELLAYSVSEHYLALRRQLGIVVAEGVEDSVPECRPPRNQAESMTITM